MAYLEIREFKAGLDSRRMLETADPGTLSRLDNGHITRGGEIEKRRALVPVHDLPTGTFGLAVLNSALHVFGSMPDPGMPAGVVYHRLIHPDGRPMTALNAVDVFNDAFYASATFDDGQTIHFYDGAVVDVDPGDIGLIPGPYVKSYGSKIYFVSGAFVVFSAVNAPTIFEDTGSEVGAGFINFGNQSGGDIRLNAIAEYASNLAIFGEQSVHIWYMDVDPEQNQKLQVLKNTGALAPRSVIEFGDIDVFYLSTSGVRSIRARDSSNAAFASDIGTAVDEIIIGRVRANPALAKAAVAALEPLEARYMLAIGAEVFVFSYFPSSKISAWSKYTFPEVRDFAVDAERMYVRSGDTVFVYGGDDLEAYDDSVVVVETPFMDGGKSATEKDMEAVDIAAQGSWHLEIALDPKFPDHFHSIGTVTGSTFRMQRIPVEGVSTHMRMRLTSIGAGYARLGKLVIHYQELDAE